VGGSRRDLIFGAVAVVILVVAAVLYFRRAGSAEAKLPERVRLYGACLACQETVEVDHNLRQTPPYSCPQCGELAVYPWYYCRDCRTQFVPTLVPREDREYPTLPVVPSCPACGSTDVGGYRPHPDLEVSDIAPLPPWPQ
jgi:predicted RNA-binding Zn-ribbon protein involved in translation (DUF1610 family)